MTPKLKNIGTNIARLRKLSGYTQKELGEKINKSAQVISNWERAYTPDINLNDLVALATALKTTVLEIVGQAKDNSFIDLDVFLNHPEIIVRDIVLNDRDKEDIRLVLELIYNRKHRKESK